MVEKCIVNKDTMILIIEMVAEESEDDRLTESLLRVVDRINVMPECGIKGVKRGKRKPTARGKFMSYCMRKPENGGLGKPMAQCSGDWKELPETQKERYKVTAGS